MDCTRTKMDNTSLGGIVRRLQLWNIHNRTTHARRPDKAAVLEVLELLAIAVNTLEFLPTPDPPSGTGTEERAVEIGSDDFAVMFDFAVDGGTLGPWDAGVCNEDVEAGVEFGNDLIDDGIDVGLVGDVELVGFACSCIRFFSSETYELDKFAYT